MAGLLYCSNTTVPFEPAMSDLLHCFYYVLFGDTINYYFGSYH